MFKRILKWLGAITAVLVIAIAIFLINLIWFRPWSLNLFYDKVFAEILFDHPEILSTLGLVEQIGLTGHNGKLDDESPAHQQREFDRWKRDLAQLRQYPVDRQSPSQKLSTRILDWFLQVQAEGEKWQYGYSCEALDARTGDRLYARENRDGGKRSQIRNRTLHRRARSGVRLQGGHAKDSGTPRPGSERIGRKI